MKAVVEASDVLVVCVQDPNFEEMQSSMFESVQLTSLGLRIQVLLSKGLLLACSSFGLGG